MSNFILILRFFTNSYRNKGLNTLLLLVLLSWMPITFKTEKKQMTEEKQNTEILKKKATLFINQKVFVCLLFLNDRFKHGYIKNISEDFFMFDDRFEGESPVFFIELRDIEPSRQKVER